MDGMTINHIVSIDHGSYGMSFFMVCAVFDKTFSWWQASVNCCWMFPKQFLPKMFCGYRVCSFSLRKIKAGGRVIQRNNIIQIGSHWKPLKNRHWTNQRYLLGTARGHCDFIQDKSIFGWFDLRVYMPIYLRMFMPVSTWICVISLL